jgi:polyhydroxyalkanoate synthesis regulator phasin
MTVLDRAKLATIGALAITKENVEKWIDELIRRGEIEQSQRGAAIKEALEKAEQEVKRAASSAKKTVGEKLRSLAEEGLDGTFVRQAEFDALLRRVEDLEAKLTRN